MFLVFESTDWPIYANRGTHRIHYQGEELGKGVGSTYTNRVDGRSSSRGNKIGWEWNKAGRSTHYELGFFCTHPDARNTHTFPIPHPAAYSRKPLGITWRTGPLTWLMSQRMEREWAESQASSGLLGTANDLIIVNSNSWSNGKGGE